MRLPHRILVTGAAGFLGGEVVRHLATRPDVAEVVAVDIDPITADLPDRVVAVQQDICDGLSVLLEEHGIGQVVHHAYQVRQIRDVASARRVNVEATARLVADAGNAGVESIVYPSSTTVYGARPDSGWHTEDESPRPIPGFLYSEHKVEAEELLRSAEREGGPAAKILRCCIVLAPGADNFITSSLSLPFMPIAIGADPDLQFLHVEDYLAAVVRALEAAEGGTWNIAGFGTVSWSELARLAGSRVIPVPRGLLRWIVSATWRTRLQNRSDAGGLALVENPWLASTVRAERQLGWTAEYSSFQAAEAWSRAL